MGPAPRRFGPSGHPFKQLQEGCVGRQRLLVTDKVLVTAREQRAGGWGWGSPVTFLTVWSGPEGEREAREETSGRRVFVQTVRGDEKWEGGEVNTGHSRGLRHVLPSGWKSQ